MLTILDGKHTTNRSVVALGMFDGVHIGHRVLLQRGAALARQRGVPLVVCTFLEHPLRVIAPDRCPPMLCSFEERNALMAELGVDVLYAMPFTREIMDLLPEEYVGHLVRRFHPTDIVCGYNHTFGRKGQGSPALLEVLGGALGFGVSVVPKITLEGQDVSSTAIRSLLQKGDVQTARAMLGRPYRLAASTRAHADGVCTLHLMDEGKQPLPNGAYRAVCAANGLRYPVLARIKDSQVRFPLPDRCALPQQVQLELLVNEAVDF